MNWRDELNRTLQAVPDDDLPEAVGELEKHRVLIWLRLQQNGSQPEREADVVALDRYLSASEVAQHLGVDVRWVYRHQDCLGAVTLSERCIRFPLSNLQRYLAGVQG